MNGRVSSVGQLNLVRDGPTTVVQIGDSVQLNPRSNAIAVQREQAIFYQGEFPFKDYDIFSRPIPFPVITENIKMTRINETPVIQVNKIDVLTTSASVIVHIGSSGSLHAESRVKHIRHLLRERPERL